MCATRNCINISSIFCIRTQALKLKLRKVPVSLYCLSIVTNEKICTIDGGRSGSPGDRPRRTTRRDTARVYLSSKKCLISEALRKLVILMLNSAMNVKYENCGISLYHQNSILSAFDIEYVSAS